MSLFPKSVSGMSHLYPPRIACFVCGAEGPADYPIFAEPQNATAHSAHFPFLVAHPPPMGCNSVKGGDNRGAKSCRPCHMSLMRQWDEYERARVHITKRAYWVKRVDGMGFLSTEAQMQAALEVQVRLQQVRVMAAPVEPVKLPYHLPHGTTVAQIGKENSSIRLGSKPALLSEERPTSAGPSTPAQTDNDSALDLSSGTREREALKSRSSVASHVSAVSHHSSTYQQSEGTSSSTTTDVSDLTLPDKNASTEVCYVCGDEFRRGTLSHTFAKQMNREPFYPSLMCHPRPSRSLPMDSSGRVQTCDECHNHLLEQWHKFEAEDMAHADRNYALRKRSASASLVDNTTFVCYICALDYHSSSLRLLYSRPNSEREPYYPFIEQQRPPPGASPISPQGMVQVCTMCYKNTKEKHHGFVGADQPPPKKRRVNSFTATDTPAPSGGVAAAAAAAAALLQDDDGGAMSTMPADVTCILCRRKFSVGSFKQLHTVGPPNGGLPFFPFLTELPRPDELADMCEDDKLDRVRACQTCGTSLINQWTQFQREQVPVVDRNYTYPSLPTGPRSLSSVRAHSPAVSHKSADNASMQQQTRTRSNTLESRPRSVSNPHSPNPKQMQQQQQQPQPPPCHSPAFSAHSAVSATDEKSTLASTAKAGSGEAGTSSSSFYCFLCGLHSDLSFSRMLYSTAPGKRAPHFPFMKSHVPKNKAETLREDGTALVCTFCYHSLMAQWSRYNDGAGGGKTDHLQRKYNLHDYNCYVCGITTYRKRIRALGVQDFPFLRHHKTRKGVITMENGEMVAVCLDCYENLRGQEPYRPYAIETVF
jgi:hypothetical protein